MASADNDAGLASGLFNTAQQVGGSLGLAILSTLAASKTSSVLGGLHGGVSTAATNAAKVSGYQVAFIAAAVMLAAGGVILGGDGATPRPGEHRPRAGAFRRRGVGESVAMTPAERVLRADAERNRRRLLDAAEALFRERGLDVGVAEIAERAGVGRGTLFRNFPSKEDLIAAIVVERMGEAVERGRALLDAPDPGEALFEFLAEIAGRQQLDRALFEAVADTWLANDEIRAAHAEIVGVLGDLLGRAQAAGAVRADIGAMDVLMLLKGVCETAFAFAHVDSEIVPRHLDLLRAAIRADPAQHALRGRTPTLEDVERAAVEGVAKAPVSPAATAQ